jgi:hypothetical protein
VDYSPPYASAALNRGQTLASKCPAPKRRSWILKTALVQVSAKGRPILRRVPSRGFFPNFVS